MPQRRLGLVAFVSCTFLAVSTAIRIMLAAATPKGAGLKLSLLLKAAAAGFYFDLATLAYAIVPLALYLILVPRKVATHRWHLWLVRFLFAIFVGVLIFDICAEYIFFDEFGTRFNFIAIDYLVYTQEVVGNIRESYPLSAIFSGIGAVAAAVCWVLRKPLTRGAELTFNGAYHRTGFLLLLPVVLSYGVVNISQSTISKNNYANEIAGNGVYNLFAAFINNELPFTRFYRTLPQNQVNARLRTLVAERNNSFVDPKSERFTRTIRAEGPEKHLNVVVVIEESLSAEYLGTFGNNKGLTPNLDRLAPQSLFFTNLYANGTRTVRGLEALTLSVPPLPGTSIVKRPNNGGFRSWGEIMNAKGYQSKYIYAGHGYFDNMNAFFSGNGYSIVDRTDFAKDEISFANVWGVCDEDLFRKVIKEGDKSFAAKKPFFSMVMTTSNHRPFTYPAGRIDIPAKKGRNGGVKYADYAIGRLIAEASSKPWFKDTIFVIVADHCAGSAGKTDIPIKKYEIPLLVYSPAHIKPAKVDKMMSQIDVAPTVLGLMNMSYQSDFLGHDVFKDSGQAPRAFISTYQKLGYLTDNELLVLGPRQYAAQYKVDRKTGDAKSEPVTDNMLADMLAYYQGADYLYQHRLNRIR
ncbi:LTA synthase family protein [Geomonas anaerohicana]|uniref:Sulfatase-like hydrolase/transferase n=1 Tax=Geomonas anaerohicana TaxID=2798583 RepID=A0ABS0YJ51_9BACT|nr:LTA synthase family protein [Geomonas anaerohicana]MBJ6752349.1 sulfatase-like hydrolase/transferase [Geomonas anaerohicana]